MERFSLSGQVAAVTGAASGLGLAMSEVLAEAGARVVLIDIDDAGLEAARARIGGSAEIGDRVQCGDAELVVREVDPQGRVAEVGLALGEEAQTWQLPLFLSGREMIALARRMLRRLTRR